MITPISIKYTPPETLVYPLHVCEYQSPVPCDLYLNLEGVSIKQSEWATLTLGSSRKEQGWQILVPSCFSY